MAIQWRTLGQGCVLSRGMSQGELLWNQCSPLSVLRPEEFKVDPQQWEALLSFSLHLQWEGCICLREALAGEDLEGPRRCSAAAHYGWIKGQR